AAMHSPATIKRVERGYRSRSKSSSPGLRGTQRLALDQRAQTTPRQLLISASPCGLPLQLLRAELPNDTRRRTHDQSARRHPETGAYEATGPDQRLLADNGVIHDHGVDTHQCAATNDAAVK